MIVMTSMKQDSINANNGYDEGDVLGGALIDGCLQPHTCTHVDVGLHRTQTSIVVAATLPNLVINFGKTT